MTIPCETDILIVGAGPTGLALGAELKRLGVSSLILDKIPAGVNTSRAAVVHARTLEVLEPLGITARLIENGLKSIKFVLRDRDTVLLRIDFTGLETQYPFALMIPQSLTEAILLSRLQELGTVVQRPCEVTRVQSHQDHVDVIANFEGKEQEIRTRWLIGCDGMHSVVREMAGIPFEGQIYTQNFVLADVHMHWPLDHEESCAFLSQKGLLAVFPLPGDHFRIIAIVDEAPPEPSLSFLQALVDERGLTGRKAQLQSVAWSSRFHVHRRMVKSARDGRILLCGDAAHVHSPAGGQGMNTGIQDSISLAQPLITALQTNAFEVLDDWAKHRHEIVETVIANTDRMTRMATVSSHSGQTLRNLALRFAGHIPAVRNAVAESLSELQNR